MSKTDSSLPAPRKRSSEEKYYRGINSSEEGVEILSDDYLSTLKLSQRAFASQYPRAYYTAFKEFIESFYNSSSNVVNVSGYAISMDNSRFLLIPSIDKPDMNVVCIVSSDLKLPDDHSYIRVKGSRTALVQKSSAIGHPALIVEAFSADSPPDSIITPDISFKEFCGTLFDNWSEISSSYVSGSIGLSLVSSPPEPQRLGGLTTDMFLEREQRRDLTKAKMLVNDVKNSLDPELFQPWKVELPTGKLTYKPFEWTQSSLDADITSSELQAQINRKPGTGAIGELSVNLASSFVAPPSVDDLAASESDLPLILPSSSSRIRRGTRDPRIANFLIAVHSSRVAGPRSLIDSWLPRISTQIQNIRLEYSEATPYSKLANPDIHATPMSIVHTAYSLARSEGSRSLNDSVLDRGVALVAESLRSALQKWVDIKQVSPRIEGLLRSFGPEERRIFFYLRDHPKSSPMDVREELLSDMLLKRFERIFKEMHEKGLIYESEPGKFSAAE